MRSLAEYLENAGNADKIAFRDENESLTFGQLRDLARRVAAGLKGLRREPVAVLMPRSPRMIAAFFGVLYSGNYYVPLDMEMGRDRVDGILDRVRPKITVTDGNFADFAANGPVSGVYEHCLDSDPAYVVFTSGSTGAPKGVVATHRNVIDYIEQLTKVLKIDDTTVFGSQTPLYVDACLKEVYTTVKTGAETVLIPKKYFSFPVRLLEFLNKYRINTVCWVASALTMTSGIGALSVVKPEHLRTVAFGSEVFPAKQLRIWRETLPAARFINLYGPTECTGMSCYYEVDRDFADDEKIPIGRAFDNTEVILHDGEILLRGAGVAAGYFNDQERTAQAFAQNPNHSLYTDTVYKTGDLAEINERGELMYAGRRDHQIKHLGYRIELAEIEAAACRLDGVSAACATYVGGKIRLFFVGDAEKPKFGDALPQYMKPSECVKLDALPLTINGKIDRRKLEQWTNS